MPKQRDPVGHPDPTPDDAQAFRAAVRDVKPLAHALHPAMPPPPGRRRKSAAAAQAAAVAQAAASGAWGLDARMPLIESTPLADTAVELTTAGASGADPASFQRGGVRTQVMRRLRRGLYPIEAELDLHGLTQVAARESLADFLAYSRAGGRRCVRIIHGKGYRSGARGPVLKVAVDLWLRRHLDVMAFTSARAIDGGTGAVYVLLRV